MSKIPLVSYLPDTRPRAGRGMLQNCAPIATRNGARRVLDEVPIVFWVVPRIEIPTLELSKCGNYGKRRRYPVEHLLLCRKVENPRHCFSNLPHPKCGESVRMNL